MLVLESQVNTMSPPLPLPPPGQTDKVFLHPGEYLPFASVLEPDSYVASILLGGRDVMGQPTLISAGSVPLTIVVRKGAARITGATDGRKAADILLWADRLGDAGMITKIQTDASGNFQLQGLRPGSYLIAAVPANSKESIRFDSLARLTPQATRISVSEGATATATLVIKALP
jgi:hypothetical protein